MIAYKYERNIISILYDMSWNHFVHYFNIFGLIRIDLYQISISNQHFEFMNDQID